MALYAVGDLQGCLTPLKQLLDHVNFDPKVDHLWLTGDLINRGPDSIDCLKFVKKLGNAASTVLGNHELHVLALWSLGITPKDKDIKATLKHRDAKSLMKWLMQQPLLVRDKQRKLIMTHAGIPPVWSDKQARKLAQEVEVVLADKDRRLAFFQAMYGDTPDTWDDTLTGHDRIRYVVNALTRMRFCTAEATLDFKFTSSPKNAPKGMKPWYQWPTNRKYQLIFGHWAALMGHTHSKNFIGLDTGYVYQNHLTLMNMDSRDRYCCDAKGKITILSELEFELLSQAEYKT